MKFSKENIFTFLLFIKIRNSLEETYAPKSGKTLVRFSDARAASAGHIITRKAGPEFLFPIAAPPALLL